jgi:hypothetical protein
MSAKHGTTLQENVLAAMKVDLFREVHAFYLEETAELTQMSIVEPLLTIYAQYAISDGLLIMLLMCVQK